MTDALARTRVTRSFRKYFCHSPAPLRIQRNRVGETLTTEVPPTLRKHSLAYPITFPYTLADYPLTFSRFPLTFSNFPTCLRQLFKGFTPKCQGIVPKAPPLFLDVWNTNSPELVHESNKTVLSQIH